MADPIGGLGKASAKMIEEIQKQAQQQVQNQQDGKFDSVMSKLTQAPGVKETQAMDGVKVITAPRNVVETLQAAKAGTVDQSIGIKVVEASQQTKGAGMKKLLGGIVNGQGKLDEIIKLATSGKQFSHQELLAVQAGVYKYSQELELTSKVVEKATSGVKQTMQTQV